MKFFSELEEKMFCCSHSCYHVYMNGQKKHQNPFAHMLQESLLLQLRIKMLMLTIIMLMQNWLVAAFVIFGDI